MTEIGAYVVYALFSVKGAIYLLNNKPLKLVDPFMYFGSNISSYESNVNILSGKSRSAIALSTI